MRRLFATIMASINATAVILNAVILSMNPEEDTVLRGCTMLLFVFLTLLWLPDALRTKAEP